MGSRRLEGRRVAVTRAAHQAQPLVDLLEAAGAEVIRAPVIRIDPPEETAPLEVALNQLDLYDAVLIGSQNAVAVLGDRRIEVPVVAVGEKTAALLADLASDVRVPTRRRAEGMVALLEEEMSPLAGRRFLFLRALEGRETAIELLTERGATVDAVAAYRIVPCCAFEPSILDSVDTYTFMSGQTLEAFVAEVPDAHRRLASATVAVIGPLAAEAAAAQGIRVDRIAADRSVASLVEALVG